MLNFIIGHKAMAGILAALIAVGVWIGLSSSSSSDSSLLSTEIVDNSGPDRDLVATLLALRAVRLDASLFTDPSFASLKDFSVEIVPEPVGRPNPFAPLNAPSTGGSASDAQFFSSSTGEQ